MKTELLRKRNHNNDSITWVNNPHTSHAKLSLDALWKGLGNTINQAMEMLAAQAKKLPVQV